jgi:hypothetical protein
MSWGSPWFVIAIIAIITVGRILTGGRSWRSGHPDFAGRGIGADDEGLSARRAAELMATENERLKGQVSRLEERIAVLERIATDPAERTAREIENLR